jgi:hypothetical protein
MANEINFDDGTGLKIETINFNFSQDIKNEYGLDDSGKLRLFIPDWEKILSSESFLDPFLKSYGIGQVYKPAIACYLEYYRATNFDFHGNPLRASLKNIRTFKINSMEYKKLLWDLLDKGKKSKKNLKLEDLSLKIEFPILDVTGHSVHELFLKAAYNEIAEPEQTPLGQTSYGKQYFKKIIRYYININNEPHLKGKKDQTRLYYSMKEIEGLKEYLSEDSIFKELRSTNFNDILIKVKKLLSRYKQKDGQSEDSTQNDVNSQGVTKEELDRIVKETLESLNEFLAGKKSKDKKDEIQKWISLIQHYYSQPEPVNLTVLVYINDKFSSKQGLIENINLQIEMLYRRCYREWAKKIFHELIMNENLTKSEKRLFILMHIGTPYLNYRIPIFDSLLLKYLNFKDLTLHTFLLSSVFKVHNIGEIDLKLMNLQLFLSFLKFYTFWLSYIRPKEKERKQNYEYNKRIVTDQFMEKTVWEDKDLDKYSSKSEEAETIIPEYEEIDLSEIKVEPDEADDKLFELLEDYRYDLISDKSKSSAYLYDDYDCIIKVKKSGIDLKKVNNFNLKELFWDDILEKYCSKDEQELLHRRIINKDSLKEIGNDLEISTTAVEKRVNKILQRLSKEKELKDILTEI